MYKKGAISNHFAHNKGYIAIIHSKIHIFANKL